MTESSATESSTEPQGSDNPYRDRYVTIPNIICAVRFVGAVSLFGFAFTQNARLFAGLFAALSLSDWIDGKLARWLNQRSDFGARFDSLADSVLYAAMFFGLVWLKWNVLRLESGWWLAAFLSYLITTSAGLWKYGKIPSYHTYGAKFSQWLMLAGAICLLLDYSVWPFRVAMLATTLTNIEATAITWHLRDWQADVLSLRHVLSQRRNV